MANFKDTVVSGNLSAEGNITGASGYYDSISATSISTPSLSADTLTVPGNVLQKLYTEEITYVCAGDVAYDIAAAVPLVTNGNQFVSAAFTPSVSSSILEITSQIHCGVGAADWVTVATFMDSTCIGVGLIYADSLAAYHTLNYMTRIVPSATTSLNFQVRVGRDGGQPVQRNGHYSPAEGIYIGASRTFIDIKEIAT